jgi:predicted aspartyl protease
MAEMVEQGRREMIGNWLKGRLGLGILALGLLFGTTGCDRTPFRTEPNISTDISENPDEVISLDPDSAPNPAPAESAEAAPDQPDLFRNAVNRASSAVAIGQSAQSQDDWQLAANRWQQALDLLNQIPADHPRHSEAQQKIQEYQANLQSAQARADRPPQPIAIPEPVESPTPTGRIGRLEIVSRLSGIPVVSANMTGSQGSASFEMLFDTGASSTLITPAMADQIGISIVGQAPVTVADGRTITVPIGRLDVLEVGGVVKNNLRVAIGGDVALLGQDFYSQYRITIGPDAIELYR